MALVDRLLAALPERVDTDPRMLAAAVRPGRVRGAVLGLVAAARRDPTRAESTLRTGLRDARQLHSRERRFVGDAVRDLLRHAALLEAAAGPDPDACYDAWLVTRGLPVGEGGIDPLERAPDLLPADGAQALAFVGSLPAFVAEELWNTWGEEAADFVAASNRRAPVVLRANRLRGDRESLAARLRAEGVETRPGALSPDALIVEGTANVEGTRAFAEGCFEVQDEASQRIAALVAPDGGLVIDLCAGAGGKSLALAGADVLATDARPGALQELRRRAARAGARVKTAPLAEVRGPASRVLVDAPCSGTGVLRRHPEYRLRWDEAWLARCGEDQGAVLGRGAELVAPGGRLVYATCSVLPREDERIVEAFLAAHADFRRLPASEVLPEAGLDLRLAPHTHGTDGFYAAVLERRR